MDQIRITFLAFLSVAVIGAGASAFVGSRSRAAAPESGALPIRATSAKQLPPKLTLAPAATRGAVTANTATPAPAPASVPDPTALPLPTLAPVKPLPALFGAHADQSADLPAFVCGASNAGAHLTLLHIQASGLDLKHGFRLGIVPIGMNPGYDVGEAGRAAMLRDAALDCDVSTLAALNAQNAGIATALVGRMAPVQIWTRDFATLETGPRLRVAYESGGESELRVRAALAQRGLPDSAITWVPKDTMRDALAAFNSGQADAVAGWQPAILEAEGSGGTPMFDGEDVDAAASDAVLVISRATIAAKPELVERFHLAWFEAVRDETLDLEAAAKAVALWGHNDWSGISLPDSLDDWRALTNSTERASLALNVEQLSQPALLAQRVNALRGRWRRNGGEAPPQFDNRFVSAVAARVRAAEKANAIATDTAAETADAGSDDMPAPANDPVNPGNPSASSALADCARIEFVPGTLEIETASRLQIEACVLPALAASPKALLRVRGSSAWPGPKGAHTREQVEAAARERAQAVIDHLVSLGVDRKRLMAATILPPPAHRESDDIAIQAADRYVDLALILPGF